MDLVAWSAPRKLVFPLGWSSSSTPLQICKNITLHYNISNQWSIAKLCMVEWPTFHLDMSTATSIKASSDLNTMLDCCRWKIGHFAQLNFFTLYQNATGYIRDKNCWWTPINFLFKSNNFFSGRREDDFWESRGQRRIGFGPERRSSAQSSPRTSNVLMSKT